MGDLDLLARPPASCTAPPTDRCGPFGGTAEIRARRSFKLVHLQALEQQLLGRPPPNSPSALSGTGRPVVAATQGRDHDMRAVRHRR